MLKCRRINEVFMNNFFKRFSIIFILTLLFSLPVFSQDWYLCVGSFKNEKNAQTLVESLKYNGFDSIIDNYEKDSELYYRVLLAQSYSDRNLARSKIKDIEKDPIIKKLKISGIWICTASEKITKKVETQTPLDVTKELVIEKEAEKKTTKTVEEKPKTSEKTSSKTKATESTKKSDKTTTSKKTTKKSSAKTETKAAVTDAKSVATVEKVEVKPIEEELPPIEDEVYDSDLLSQAKKYEKEIAEKNKIAEKTTVSEEPAKESAKETDKEVIPETENEAESEANVETKTEENVETKTEAKVEAEPELETETERPAESSEAAVTPAPVKEETEEPEELPSITLEINNAASDFLKVNYAEELAFSEEKPYTVFVRSYRDAKRAEYDKKRLGLIDSQPSVLKTYSDANGFLFSLYAGAFETQEEAEELAENLEKLGIENTQVRNYNVLYSSIKKYNDFVMNNTITAFNLEKAKLPEGLNADISTCIKDFPLNYDYELEELIIYDVQNVLDADEEDNEYIQDLDNYIYQKNKVSAAITCILKDPLYENSLTVYIQHGKDFTIDEFKTETERKITVGIEDYHGYISEVDGIYIFTGTNDENDSLIKITSDNLSDISFNSYLTTVFEQNGLYNNNSFKNSLASIAKAAPEKEREFEYCIIGNIKEADAEESFGDFAKAVTGNTWIWSYFYQEDQQIEVMSLNLIYDWLSEKYYADFMDNKMELQISETNRPSFVPFVDSWYYKDNSEELIELSAKVKSYFITASAYEDSLTERELVYFIEDTELLKH